MLRNPAGARVRVHVRVARRAGAVAAATATVALLATGCTGSHDPAPAGAVPVPSDPPGQVTVKARGIDMLITDAVVHLTSSGAGTLTMTLHHGDGVPEHLDMVAAPEGGRGVLTGAAKGENGMMTDAGILLPAGTTVTFGGDVPAVRFPRVDGVTAAHTLPLSLQFGVAGLVHLTARVEP